MGGSLKEIYHEQLLRKRSNAFDPEGMHKYSLSFYFKELRKLYYPFQNAREYTQTTSQGYLDYAYGHIPALDKGAEEFISKNGKSYDQTLMLANYDGSHKIIVLLNSRKIDFHKYLRSYCRVYGTKMSTRGNTLLLFADEISYSDPEYNFETDPQFQRLAIENIDDILSFFPTTNPLNQREEKEKSLLFSLIGAQEKQYTRGGVGISILSPSHKFAETTPLLKDVSKCWFPFCTRNAISKDTSSFLAESQDSVSQRISDDPTNFLRYKINRSVLQNFSTLKHDKKALGLLSYSHCYVYLDGPMDWLEPSNAVEMHLFRARNRKVITPPEVVAEAKNREINLQKRIFEEFNFTYNCPDSVLAIAECIAKLNGDNAVTNAHLHEAEKIIYPLRKESADAVGVEAELFSEAYRGRTGAPRQVYNIISSYEGVLSRSEMVEMAVKKGLSVEVFNKIVDELSQKGEIYSTAKDGAEFLNIVRGKGPRDEKIF